MTKRVKIVNDDASNHVVLVDTIELTHDEHGSVISGTTVFTQKITKYGDSVDVWIHKGREVRIREE